MIQLYWKNATAQVVGAEHGLSDEDISRLDGPIRQAQQAVRTACLDGSLGYAKLPTHKEYPAQIKAMVERYRGASDVVVLGIGGSALGNTALQNALNPPTYNLLSDRKRGGPRLFVLDNVDPDFVDSVLGMLGRRLSTTVFNVISKSGETAETASQFMVVRRLLAKRLGEGYAQRIVATTDTAKGTLHDIAKREGYAMLPVPDDVGGRFSVLSPVGLFSAAMCGIDIDELLAGAAEMQQRVQAEGDWRRNPACLLAAIKINALTAKGQPMHVMMPYSNRLYSLADWYRQLWAESLGKRVDRAGNVVRVGPTPIKALGATDQHSQVQLYREGPTDKLVVFLEVQKHPAEVRMPDDFADVPGMSYLRSTKMSKLLNAEKAATEYALAVSNVPSVTIRFEAITPHTVGEFIYLYEYATSLAGELLNINAYDQPGVEMGKKATFALMGRQDQEELAKQMAAAVKLDKKYLA